MPYYWYRRYGKRIFDLLLTVPAIFLLFPLFVAIGVLLLIMQGNPILFKQKRAGLFGKPFILYKFRTMTDSRDDQGNLLPDSYRLTIFGRFLRRFSLDELPELINVLIGDMSLVGPRPLLMRYIPYFREEELVRFSVKPGITGLAQVTGRNDLPWDERFRLDTEYARNVSFLSDIRILCLTLVRVISRRGVKVDPGSVMLDLDKERENKYLG